MLRRALALSIELDKELKQLEDWSTYNDRTLSTNTHRTSKFPATDKAVASYGKNVDTIDQKNADSKKGYQGRSCIGVGRDQGHDHHHARLATALQRPESRTGHGLVRRHNQVVIPCN
ncbi:unnamed protein product [Fusarium graminearum]|nr:unnamed protein product [Fusarium graminearum]